MAVIKRKIRHGSEQRSSGVLIAEKRPGNRRKGETSLSAKVTIDRYMEALRKGVTLSQ